MRTEVVKAFDVIAEGYTGDAALTKEIQEFVKTRTAPHQYPRKIEIKETLPKTNSGKIRRVELRAQSVQGWEIPPTFKAKCVASKPMQFPLGLHLDGAFDAASNKSLFS